MSIPTPVATARITLPRPLHDFVVEMAIAVHKRSIYPPGHPILQGAVEGVFTRLSDLLETQAELSIGVAERRLVVDGMGSEDAHPLLSEFAARLADHQIGAIRVVSGVSRDELDAFLGAVSGPTDEIDDPLGRRPDVQSDHITVHPIAFERLGLLASEAVDLPKQHEDATWRALASAALDGAPDEGTGDTIDPHVIAEAIGARTQDESFDASVIERLSQMLDDLGDQGPDAPYQQRQRLSELVAGIGAPALTRLLQAGGAERGVQVLRTANEALAARAVIELVRAASGSEPGSISVAMLRLLQKLSTQSQAPGVRGGDAERVLRGSVRRLLDNWTLQNPNPERYERVLESAAARAPRRAPDQRREVAEPERLLDLALETQVPGTVAETALARLAVRDGLAAVLERLQGYHPSPVREALVDRLLNESSLREYLGQPVLDLPLLRQAVDRMKSRAIAPLITALEGRSESDAAAIVELLARLGWDVLEPLGDAVPGASPRLLRHYIAVFDRLDAWPPQVNPTDYVTHADVVVQREAIKYLLRAEATRETAVLAALRSRDVRTLSLGLTAVARHCSPAAARILVGRYHDPDLAPDLRVRLIRAVGASATSEAQAWLGGLVISRRWLLGWPRLRKPTAEAVAAASAIMAHVPDSRLAAQLTALLEASRVPEYRRLVTRATGGAA